MPPIRTSVIPNSRQQIKERLLALQNALPVASSSSQQDSPVLPLVATACSTTDSNTTTTAAPVRSIRSQQEWDKDKGSPIPIEFAHRPEQWESLCAHFNSQSNKEKGARMSEARKSEKKKDHTTGKVLFAHLAKKQRTDGKVAPHLEAYMDAYSATDPDGTARVRAATNEAVAKIMADWPATEEGSECSIQLPLDEEIHIIESEIGSSRGIRIQGFGSSFVKESKKRGPMEPVHINLQMAARIAQQDARITEQDARIAKLEARQKAELEAMEVRQKANDEAFQKASDEAMEARVRDLVSSMIANILTGDGRPREV